MMPGVIAGHMVGPAGASGGGVTITLAGSYNVNNMEIDPSNAYAEFRLESDNDIITVEFSGDVDNGDWMVPRGGAPSSGYEVRCTVNSGTTPAGSATGSWLALSSDRFWSLSRTNIGTVTCNLTIEIRDAVSLVVLDSCTVVLTATVEF